MAAFLDIPTLLIVGVLAGAIAALTFALLWCCDRCQIWLGAMAQALVAGTLATAFFVTGIMAPSQAATFVGHALLALAYGLAWRGFLAFDNRRRPSLAAAVGALVWLPFLAVPLLRQTPGAAAALSAAVIGGYSLAIAWQLHAGGRREPLPARRPAAALFALHGLAYLGRIPLLALYPSPAGAGEAAVSPWFALATLESLILTLVLVVSVLVLSAQRAAACHCRAMQTDALTGLPNHHAFFATIGPMIEQSSGDGALLIFDLDHFHVVNDRFGREHGDEVLVAVASALNAEVQSPDVFARIGDEEFALYMPSVGIDVGLEVAEYLCRKVEALKIVIDGEPVALTTSVGVASLVDVGRDAEALRAGADLALGESKRIGRNRARAYRKASHLQDLMREAWRRAG